MEPRAPEVPEYDPALVETLREGSGDDEVSVIARLTGDHPLPEGVRIVTQFGDIATLRVRRDRIPELAASEAVADLEASHGLTPELELDVVAEVGIAIDEDIGDDTLTVEPEQHEVHEEQDVHDVHGMQEMHDAVDQVHDERAAVPIGLESVASTYTRRPAGVRATGRGVVIAVLDWGCDFAHPAFRKSDGKTRLLAIWDQRRTAGAMRNRWGYGRVITRAEIDRALASDTPYTTLRYHPGDADRRDPSTGDWEGAHGTHVLDIAAGNGRGGGMSGVAPGADLIFVHLSGTVDVLGRRNLGDSVTVLEALDFVFETAGDRPCVVNMSVGAHGGPKDGTTLVELGIDRAIWLKRGRITVHSCGNYYTANSHAQGRLRAGQEKVLRFAVPASDPTPSEIEVWYSGGDRFTARVVDHAGHELASVMPGGDAPLAHGGDVLGHIYHARNNANGDHLINIFLNPMAPAGTWQLKLRGDTVVDGRFHAYIERETNRPNFLASDVARTNTTGTICNGRLSIAVGAYDPHTANHPMASFSSSGPTRDGRVKPELIAPGVRIRAAKSTPPGGTPRARYTSLNGTSMAAPHVAGTIALLFEAAGELLEIYDTRALLLSSLDRRTLRVTRSEEVHRIGLGYLDIAAVERNAQRWNADHDERVAETVFEPNIRDEPIPVDPMPRERAAESLPDDDWRETETWESAEDEDADYSADDIDTEDIGIEHHPHDVIAPAPALAEVVQTLLNSGVGDPLRAGHAVLATLGLPTEGVATPIALAGMRMPESVREGDILVRSNESLGGEHTGIIIGRPAPPEELEARGVRVESAGYGTYVEVLESPDGRGPRIIGRKLLDTAGRMPRRQEIRRISAVERESALPEWQQIGQLAAPGGQVPLEVEDQPTYTTTTLDDALQFALHRDQSSWIIRGDSLRANRFECLRLRNPVNTGGVDVIDADIPGCDAVLFDGHVYVPAHLINRGTRWVRLPRAAAFYALAAADRNAQRRQWVNALAGIPIIIPGVRVNRRWLNARSMPTLRVLLTMNAQRAFPTRRVDQPDRQFRGGSVNGRTLPLLSYPLEEPDCYVAVIANVEGRLEAINAYDLGAGISLGSIQINIIRTALFHFLERFQQRDATLFRDTLGQGAHAFSVQAHAGHTDLVIGTGANAVTLHGQNGDRTRNVAWFQSGHADAAHADFNDIDADHRLAVTRRFRDAVVWPHVQDMINETSAWYLTPGLAMIHDAANHIPPLDVRDPDRDTFILKALLLSAYVRYSACLAPLLQALRRWNTPAEKLAHIEDALNDATVPWGACTANRRGRLRQRLQQQRAHASEAFEVIQRLRERAGAAAAPVVPAPAPARAPGQPDFYIESGHHTPASVFLPPRSGDYTEYIRAQTTGRIQLLLNGRSSGGSGPDIDMTEPLTEMERVVRSLRERDRVLLGSWFFDAFTPLTLGPYRTLDNWGGLLAAKAIEGVTVRIIINDFDPISGQDVLVRERALVPLRRLVAAMPQARRDNLKFILSLHPAHFGRLRSSLGGQRGPIYIASHHQKFMCARSNGSLISFCGGVDIERRKHPASWSYSGLIAWHDMHMKLVGPIAYDVEQEFVMRWNRERANSRQALLPGWRPLEELQPSPQLPADFEQEKRVHQVQLTRTVSSDATFAAFRNDRDDIRQAYRRVIGHARRFLYFENQYLRSPDVAEDIVRQGRAHQNLQVIFVVVASAADDDGDNVLTRHGNYLQYTMLDTVMRALGRGRMRVYTMYNRAVHAKALLADDHWASIGSANCNERSFQLDSELNLTIDDEEWVREARIRNWSFILGEPLATVRGWSPNTFFANWDRVANLNVRAPNPQAMQGAGIIPFDYTQVRGQRSRVIPDYLVKLDFGVDMPTLPGTLPQPTDPRRPGVAYA